MGGIGRCCCTCECLLYEDLPTLEIANWTAGAWQGSTCCFTMTFTPAVSQSWSKTCSSDIFTASFSEQCETFHYELLNNARTNYRSFPFDCENLDPGFCCPGELVHVSTTNTTLTGAQNAFMAVWRRPARIVVQISQEEVDCENAPLETGGCKIVVRTRYVYEYATRIYKGGSGSTLQTVSLNESSCFSVNPEFEMDVSSNNIVTCSDVPSEPDIGSCGDLGEFYFDRVRYFDTMPTESITFNNTHIPGCTASSCNYEPYNYASQVCIQSPAAPINIGEPCDIDQPCGCSEVDDETELYVVDDFVCTGGVFLVVDGCDEPGEFPLCTVVTTDCQNTIDDYVCSNSGWTSTRTGFRKENCPSSFVGLSGEGYPVFPFDPDAPKYSGCGAYSAIGLPGGALFIPKPHAFLSVCDDDPCNAGCCETAFDCPACGIDDCVSKYAGVSTASINSHTITRNCSGFSSQSVCVSAPTWTIAFSE